MTQQEKEHNLLVRILSEICNAGVEFNYDDLDDCWVLDTVRYSPPIMLNEDDIELIRQLGEQECEDFSPITCLLDEQ